MTLFYNPILQSVLGKESENDIWISHETVLHFTAVLGIIILSNLWLSIASRQLNLFANAAWLPSCNLCKGGHHAVPCSFHFARKFWIQSCCHSVDQTDWSACCIFYGYLRSLQVYNLIIFNPKLISFISCVMNLLLMKIFISLRYMLA